MQDRDSPVRACKNGSFQPRNPLYSCFHAKREENDWKSGELGCSSAGHGRARIVPNRVGCVPTLFGTFVAMGDLLKINSTVVARWKLGKEELATERIGRSGRRSR